MKKFLLSILLILITGTLFASILTDYVYKNDNSYKYTIVENTTENNAHRIVANMTSQIWQNMEITNTVVIIIPNNCKVKDKAVLLNTGGSYKGGSLWAQLGTQMSKLISCPICIVFDIPNQPMWGKKEDALMSHTFKQALEANKIDEYPLILQMAKSVIKSLDTIEDISSKELDTKINKFIITGASKRGWTSWISAGTKDKRIIGIMPIVYDWLDMKSQITHQKEYYETLSAQIGDYTQLNFDKFVFLPEAKTILGLVDPYYYDVSIPKLIINASNDPYWTLDSSSIYYPKLKGDKYLYYKVNASHDMGLLKFSDNPMAGFVEILPMINIMKTFIYHEFLNEKMETIDWVWSEKDNKINCELKMEGKPVEVFYYTKDVEKRDFRQVNWEGVKLEPNSDGKYIFTKDKPKKGYCGSYIEVKFKSDDGTPYSLFTTPYVSK